MDDDKKLTNSNNLNDSSSSSVSNNSASSSLFNYDEEASTASDYNNTDYSNLNSSASNYNTDTSGSSTSTYGSFSSEPTSYESLGTNQTDDTQTSSFFDTSTVNTQAQQEQPQVTENLKKVEVKEPEKKKKAPKQKRESTGLLSLIVILILIFSVLGVIIYIVKDSQQDMSFLDSLSDGTTTASVRGDNQAITTNNITIKGYLYGGKNLKKDQLQTLTNAIYNSNVNDQNEAISIIFNGSTYTFTKRADIDTFLNDLTDSDTYSAKFANDTRSDDYAQAAYYSDGAIKNIWISKE